METKYYTSRVDWWVYAIVVFTVVYCLTFAFFLEDYWLFISMAVVFGGFEIFVFASVKYAVRGNEIGVRGAFFKWHWYPVDKISTVKKTSGILAASALSARRIAIRFSDRKTLKSSAPLEISPADRDAFIDALVAINPDIRVD